MNLPTLARSSSHRAWVQVVRGVGFFVAGALVVFAVVSMIGWTKDAWDRHQRAEARKADLAAAGLREPCRHQVSTGCAERAADLAATKVAYVEDSGWLWVATRKRQFKALESSYFGDLYTRPIGMPKGIDVRVDRTVDVDGVEVTLWMRDVSSSRAGNPPRVWIIYATWERAGERYGLSAYFGPDPIATVRTSLRTIHYATPH